MGQDHVCDLVAEAVLFRVERPAYRMFEHHSPLRVDQFAVPHPVLDELADVVQERTGSKGLPVVFFLSSSASNSARQARTTCPVCDSSVSLQEGSTSANT